VAAADEAAVLAQMTSAEKLMGEQKTAQAEAALKEAGAMIVKDAAGSGAFGETEAGWVQTEVTGLHKGAAGYDIMGLRVKDLYGGIIPASKGDFAAAAAYAKKLADGSSGVAKAKLETAVKALNDAAAGKGDKELAQRRLSVTLGATVFIGKALDLADKKQFKEAARYVNAAGTYMRDEAKVFVEKNNIEIKRASTELLACGDDLRRGEEAFDNSVLEGLINDAEGAVMQAGAAAPAEAPKEVKKEEPKKAPAAKGEGAKGEKAPNAGK